MFHTLHAQLFEIELLNMGRKHSGTGVIPAQAAVLRDIEIGAELKPHIPEIHTGFDSLISCHPQGGEGVGVGDPLPLASPNSSSINCRNSDKRMGLILQAPDTPPV